MRTKLILLALLITPFSFSYSQNPKEKDNSNQTEKVKYKKVKVPVLCSMTKQDEIQSLADGKIFNPGKIKQIKREIAYYTSCSVENIFIISGKSSGNTAEYIACVCGTQMKYNADYTMRIHTVRNIEKTIKEPIKSK